MTREEKLAYLQTLLGEGERTELSVYLDLTAQEVVQWKYSLIGVPESAEVPAEDEVAQIMACAAGYGHKGAPDQTQHTENTTARTWKHADMVAAVRSMVIPFAKVM